MPDFNEVFERASKRFLLVQSYYDKVRRQCLEDRRFTFISGAQWEGSGWETQFANRPRLEVNKTHQSVMKIISEYRNNRVYTSFAARDGGDKSSLSDNVNKVYRANEQDCNANEAYDTAYEEGVAGGIGAWRLRAVLEDENDEENEKQKIIFESIPDADTRVFFDPNSKRADKSDAEWCFVLNPYDVDVFKDEFDEEPSGWNTVVSDNGLNWLEADVVYIAEYYEYEYQRIELRKFKLLSGEIENYTSEDFKNDEGLASQLMAIGAEEVSSRKIKRRRVRKYLLSGGGVLEDCGLMAGENIPVIPYYGKRVYISNIEYCIGHIRFVKDAQRLKNIQLSKLAEIASLSSVEKPIFTPQQVQGFQHLYMNDNIENYSYLLVNPIQDASGNLVPMGALDYTRPPSIPPALAALLQITEEDIRQLLGNQQEGEKIVSNTSGKAIEMVQQSLDATNFIYLDNMACARKRSAEVWLSMARELYIEEGRKLKGIDKNDEVASIELMQAMVEDGVVYFDNDFREANFDVICTIGASSQSKKQATVRTLTEMMGMTSDPETTQVLGAAAMMNAEGEGIEDVRNYFRKKLINMGVVKPTEAEMFSLQQEAESQGDVKPDANTVYLQAAADAERARGDKARADTVYTLAKEKETQAKTAEILAGIDGKEIENAQRVQELLTGLQSQEQATVQPVAMDEIGV
jgi:hypothetical protein